MFDIGDAVTSKGHLVTLLNVNFTSATYTDFYTNMYGTDTSTSDHQKNRKCMTELLSTMEIHHIKFLNEIDDLAKSSKNTFHKTHFNQRRVKKDFGISALIAAIIFAITASASVGLYSVIKTSRLDGEIKALAKKVYLDAKRTSTLASNIQKLGDAE